MLAEQRGIFSSVWNIPWRRNWQPTPGCFLGKPTDRGAWRATVHGVARVGCDLATKLNYASNKWVVVV